jgi:hypothetical protein
LWTESGDKINIDPYSVITKALGFIAYYSTPHAHSGLYVFATDPDDYTADVEEYNEIFIALISEGWQNGRGDFDDFASKMTEARAKIDQTIEDITLHYDKVDLQQKPVGWLTVKKTLEGCVIDWFESNGYVPHTGISSRVPPHGPCPPAYPPAKLLPLPKANPLNTSGQNRRALHVGADPIRPSDATQVAQYVPSVTKESEAAPSPSSAGASRTQIDTLGKCNFDNPHNQSFSTPRSTRAYKSANSKLTYSPNSEFPCGAISTRSYPFAQVGTRSATSKLPDSITRHVQVGTR